MEETQRLKKAGHIGYRLKNDTYSMVDFGTGEILNVMNEVAVLYDGNVMLKHGSLNLIKSKFNQLVGLYQLCGISSHGLHIIQGKIPIDEIDKMLSITGYLPPRSLTWKKHKD